MDNEFAVDSRAEYRMFLDEIEVRRGCRDLRKQF